MGVEIERKFLVSEPPPWLGECPSEEIEQGYLAVGTDHEVRLRRSGDELVLTVKTGHGEERGEQEIELSRDQFEALWPLTEGRRVHKRRHRVEGEPTLEVDVYLDGLEGLVTTEAEFPSAAASHEFDPPDWLGRELTDEPGYANQRLALHGMPG